MIKLGQGSSGRVPRRPVAAASTVPRHSAYVDTISDETRGSGASGGGKKCAEGSSVADILRLLATGLPDRAIAEALFLSVRTVEAHVARILAKLGVHTRTAAVAAALADGLAEPRPLAPD